jgi:hypothetical protein
MCSSGLAQEMDHTQHAGQDMDAMAMEHPQETGEHEQHDSGTGMWMFEYRYMGMFMDGLRDGTDSVGSRDISGALPGTPPIKDPAKDYMMAPTEMDMHMHMLMVMYGVSDSFSLMGMLSYLDNDMDMVMHMPTMDMFGDMSTNGLGDSLIEGLYKINRKWTAALGVSIPTGEIDEKVTMKMSARNGMSAPPNRIQAPYTMQLGTGTFDLIPKIRYADMAGSWSWSCEALYRWHLDENDNDYTWGNIFEATGLGQYAVNKNLSLSGRMTFINEQEIDGQDSDINPMMAPTSDPDAYGGTSVELMAGANVMFGRQHLLGFEIGAPIYQDLNGPQLETDLLLRFQYQFMIMP